MNKKIMLSTVVSVSLYGSLNAATFDFSSDSSGTTNLLTTCNKTVDGVTTTITTNTGSNFVHHYAIDVADPNRGTTDNTFLKVSFDRAINISTLSFFAEIMSTRNDGSKLIFTPTGGTNSAEELNYDSTQNYSTLDYTGNTFNPSLSLNWSNITSFEITTNGTALIRTDLNKFEFTIADIKTYIDSAVLANAESNTKRSAQILQNIKDNGLYTAMSSVFTSLDALSTDTQKAQKIEETTPQTATTSVSASNHVAQGISNIVVQRQNINLASGLSSGDKIFSEKNVWFKPFGSIGSQNDKDGINGFDIDTYGLALGVDGEYEENQTFGVGFFYTNANVDVNNVEQSSQLDVFSLVAYGSNPIIDSKTKLMYQVGYSLQKNDSSRFVSLTSDTASAYYTSKTASLDLKVLRDYRVNDELLLQPMISTTYRHFKNPSYSESGAGALNLDVQSFTSTELLVGIGSMAHYNLNDSSKIIGNVNVDYDLHDKTTTVSSSYQGATGVTFDTDGIDNGRWSYDVGVAYENQMTDLSNINFSYNYQGKGSDYSNNVISAKYTYKF